MHETTVLQNQNVAVLDTGHGTVLREKKKSLVALTQQQSRSEQHEQHQRHDTIRCNHNNDNDDDEQHR